MIRFIRWLARYQPVAQRPVPELTPLWVHSGWARRCGKLAIGQQMRLSPSLNGCYDSVLNLRNRPGNNMISFRALSRVAFFCAVGIFISFPGQPAFAQNLLSEQCIKFTCKQSSKRCNSGGFISTVTVDANTAIQGCPSDVTVWYDDHSSITPFPYYICGCRQPSVTRITK